jgi:hypothetical protein
VIEILLVLGVAALMIGAGFAVLMVPWYSLLIGGFACTFLGMVVGVPTGFYYHVQLRRILLENPPLPDQWWLHPTRYHDRVKKSDRKRYQPWFVAGAVGFMICMLGCLLCVLGMVRMP